MSWIADEIRMRLSLYRSPRMETAKYEDEIVLFYSQKVCQLQHRNSDKKDTKIERQKRYRKKHLPHIRSEGDWVIAYHFGS